MRRTIVQSYQINLRATATIYLMEITCCVDNTIIRNGMQHQKAGTPAAHTILLM